MDSLHRLGALWQETFINSPIAIAIVSTSGKFAMVNPSFCKLLGYSEPELIAARWQDLTHPEDLLKDMALVFDIATGVIDKYTLSKRYIKKDGEIVSTFLMVSAIKNSNGELQYFLSQVIDITELTRLREASKSKLTFELKNEILIALQEKEFYLEYEPIHNLKTGEIVGHEGLIRWQHPYKGLIRPLDFIPACEEDGELMAKVCGFVVREGVREVKGRDTWISLNVSPQSLLSEPLITGYYPKFRRLGMEYFSMTLDRVVVA
jgi:PAS domain S-box-containing protein